MWKGLFDGITVPPSVGRRQKTSLPIPEVIGTDITESNDPPSGVDASAIPAVISTHKPFAIDENGVRRPFEIDISDQLRVHGGEPPFDINLIGVNVYTFSSIENDRISTEIPATLDEHGILTYNPAGTYLYNALSIRVEIADEAHPPTPDAQIVGAVYEAPFDGPPEPDIDPRPVIIGENLLPGQVDLEIQMEPGNYGDPEYLAQFWSDQGQTPTCVAAAVGSSLDAMGLGSYEEVLRRTTVYDVDGEYFVYDANGNFVPGTNTLIQRLGQPIYHAFVALDDNGNPTYLPNGELSTFDTMFSHKYDPVLFKPDSTLAYKSPQEAIFEGFGVESHVTYMTDFTQLIGYLKNGQMVIASVDALELWGSNGALLTEAQENADSDWNEFYTDEVDPLASGRNHAVWITGIKNINDPENATIIINDSNRLQGEGGAEYSLQRFLAAWEDGEFYALVTGDPLPPRQLPFNEATTGLATRMIRNWPYQAIYDAPEDIRSQFQMAFPENFQGELQNYKHPKRLLNLDIDPEAFIYIVDAIEEESPGFKEAYAEWTKDLQAEQIEILNELGISPEAIKLVDEIKANLIDE